MYSAEFALSTVPLDLMCAGMPGKAYRLKIVIALPVVNAYQDVRAASCVLSVLISLIQKYLDVSDLDAELCCYRQWRSWPSCH